MRYLVCGGGGLGNMVQATPLIEALSTMGRCDVYCDATPPGTEEIIDAPTGKVSRDPKAFAGASYDAVCQTFCASRAFGVSSPRWIKRPHPVSADLQEAENEWMTAVALGYEGPLTRPRVVCDDPGKPWKPYVVLCDGSKDKPGPFGRHRRYESWDVVCGILRSRGVRVVVVGVSADGGPFGCEDRRGKLSIRDTATVIACSRAWFGNDTGLMHVAAALSIPTVVVWGPSHLKKSCPPGEHVKVLMTSSLPCRPCIFRKDHVWKTCRKECMRVDPKAVADAVYDAARWEEVG